MKLSNSSGRFALTAASAGIFLGFMGMAMAVAPVGKAGAAGKPDRGQVSNPYSPAYGHAYRHGVTPTVGQQGKMNGYARSHRSATTATGPETLSYGGGIDGIGVTSGTPKVYLVFWGSQWGTQGSDSNGNVTLSNDPDHGAPYLQQLFKGLGTNNELWSGTMTQYCDGSGVAAGSTSCPTGANLIGYPTGGAFAGVWYDNSASEPSAASGHQIGQEAVNAAAHFGNTTAASNRYVQYDILSPTGLNPDNYKTGGFCAWHDYNGDSTLTGGAVSSPYGDVAFTNMPYVMDQGTSCGMNFVNSSGTLDGYSIVNGHEYAETVTDQNPAGGWTNTTGSSFNGQENGDECAWISTGQGASANVAMATGSFAMQSTWSNDTNRCDISHPIVGGTVSNDFSISDSPTSGSVTAGSAATTTVSTAVTSGSVQTVSLSASGLPSGASASFNPSSVTAGGSSTLTITTSSSTPAGTSTVTITGTGSSATHSTTYSLTVTTSGSVNLLGNPGFENGSSSPAPWTATSGVISNNSAEPPHSGTWDAWMCGYGTTHTDTLSQPVSIPSASSASLSFWRHIDTAETGTTAHDTMTVQVLNSSGTVLSTLHTYSNLDHNTGYAQDTYDLSAYTGQSVTLKFSCSENSSLQTSFVIDDTSLTTGGSPPPTTTTTAPTTTTTTTTVPSTTTTTTVPPTTTTTAPSTTTTSTTVPSTTTTTIPSGTNLLGNPGFENGTNSAPWTATSGVINNSSSEPPHSGSWDAWLDGYGTTHTDTLAQTVTIPSASGATLSFWLHIDTAETTTTTAYDTLTLQVLNSSGAVLATLHTWSNLNHHTGYSQQTLDMSSFVGQTVTLKFTGTEDSSLQTSFVIDDTSLTTH